jgi:deoxyribodipyrimidine photolyase-related protein
MTTASPTVWILEDQLSLQLPSLRASPTNAPVLLIESRRAMRMLPYHRKRLVFLVSAMRHFADELRKLGRDVRHYPLREHGYLDSLGAIRDHVQKTRSREFWIVRPSDHHTQAWIDTLTSLLGISIRWFDNTLFLTNRIEFRDWATSVRSPLMETFYRRMRQKHGVLMDGGKPVGGEWNLDKLNRKRLPSRIVVPPMPSFAPDSITRQVIRDIDRDFPDHYGSTTGFDLPVTREDARRSFDDFLEHRLPLFGDYEDAMSSQHPLLFHSLLSPVINVGLLDPMSCIRATEKQFRDGKVPLNSAEGFIRQLLGWREYVYGIYWSFMPEYRDRNAHRAERELPDFFWDGRTEMNCLRHAVGAVVERGYAHHIQRLMVIGNFATLAGLSPQAVNDWFLTMFVDSHDWIVTPNVIGMATNADGGTMATKPYVSSGAYIDRMSDYCKGCRYSVSSRTGDDACPFNHLYWSFLHRHRKALGRNVRMSMMLRNLDRIDPAEMKLMLRQSDRFLESLPRGRSHRLRVL